LPESPVIAKKSKLRRFEGVSDPRSGRAGAFSRNHEPKAKDLISTAD